MTTSIPLASEINYATFHQLLGLMIVIMLPSLRHKALLMRTAGSLFFAAEKIHLAATMAFFYELDPQNELLCQWRTFHMSEHLPMWLELPIDFGKEYLERVASAKS